jgi:polar amino acid transport system substrate-binding protein
MELDMASARLVATLSVFLSIQTPSSIASAADAKPLTLKFATEPYPPFQYEEAGKPAGPLIEILEAVCSAAELECTAQMMPMRRTLTTAGSGMLDGITIALRTPEREKSFYVSDDVVRTSLTLFTRAGSGFNYHEAQDLNNTSIGVYGPSGTSITLNELAKGTTAQIEIELDNLTTLKKLAAGRYGARGAAFINRDVATVLIKENNIEGIVAAGDAKIIDYAFGLSRSAVSAEQAELFNEKLRLLKHNGTVKKILQKYGLTPAP